MGRVRGGMASSSVPAPLRASVLSSAAIPVVCIALCPLSPFRTHSPLPPPLPVLGVSSPSPVVKCPGLQSFANSQCCLEVRVP